jgi:hypothetical protein
MLENDDFNSSFAIGIHSGVFEDVNMIESNNGSAEWLWRPLSLMKSVLRRDDVKIRGEKISDRSTRTNLCGIESG